MSEQPQTRIQLLDQLVEITHKLRDLEANYKKARDENFAYAEHEVFFQNIFQKANDLILILRERTIIHANPKFCEAIGASVQEVIGTDLRQYIHQNVLTEALQKYEERLRGKHSSVVDRTLLVRKDGSEVDVEFDAARITYGGEGAILVIFTDVTYLKRAEEELVRLRPYQLSLTEHVNIWLDVLDQNGNVVIWNKAAEQISGYSKADVIGHAKIWEYLYPDKNYRDKIFARAMRIVQEGENILAFETNIVTRDGRKKVISWHSRDLTDNGGHTIGSFEIGLDVTAERAATEELSRANEALKFAYDQTIEGWSRALDLRDRETEGHSQRVAELTLDLARMAGMSETELVDLRRGALLHDIGKLGVPDSILLKPDKLTDDERAQMHKHPEYAHMLLSPIEYLHSAIDIPYCHHERWDGTGYPRGLKGEQIPLAARLFAVADIWDAIRSDRPYRKGWSAEEAMEYIKSQTGTHLDPQAVEYFLSIAALYK